MIWLNIVILNYISNDQATRKDQINFIFPRRKKNEKDKKVFINIHDYVPSGIYLK